MADTMDPLPQQGSFTATPQTQLSHIRGTSSRTATSPAAATRPGVSAKSEAQQPPPQAAPQLSAPASQESFLSVQSMGASESSAAAASNATQVTDYTEELIDVESESMQGPLKDGLIEVSRMKTPEESQRVAELGPGSPMSIVTSPVNVNGAKRTASGHVKNAPSLPTSPVTFTRRHARGESTSSTGSRAGDLAACLKTRLGYAMAKVQHGWEHRSIAEVEQLAAHKVFSSTNRHSASHVDYYAGLRPGTSGFGAERTSVFDHRYATPSRDETTSPPTKRQSGVYAQAVKTSPPINYNSVVPRLQPAAEFRAYPSSSTSCSPSYAPPPHIQSIGTVMSPPRTPLGRQHRPQPLRTDTQTAQAERDAVQALFELGSPHASQISRYTGASQDSSAHGSPLRSEFSTTPRKVKFARSESNSGSSARHSSIDSNSLVSGAHQ